MCENEISNEVLNDTKCSYEYKDNYNGEVHIKTKWFGDKTNKKIKCDCLYIRLHNIKESNAQKYIKIKSFTMTDIGMETEEREITDLSFDQLTDTAYIRYQPKYQTCVGMSFDIKTNCPIVSMNIGYIPLDEMAQISQINI